MKAIGRRDGRWLTAAVCAGLSSLPFIRPAGAESPAIRIAHAGALVGVVRGAVVIDAGPAKRAGRDLQAFDVRDGSPLAGNARLARVFASRPGSGGVTAMGDVLLGETPGQGGITFFDPRANAHLSISAGALSYMRRFPPPASRRLAAVGPAPDSLAVVGVSTAKGECAVAVEARPLNKGRARWRWSPPGSCWAITFATDRERLFVHAGPSIHALALATGKEIWRAPSPCAGDPTCIAELAAGEQEVALAAGGSSLAVYSAASGSVIRQLAIDDLGEPRVLTLRDHRACMASSSRRRLPDTTVMCVGVDGQHRWTQRLGGDLNSLELEHDIVYVAAGGAIRALAAISGETRWTFGGDRISLARLSDGVRVVLGTDGVGALILPEGSPPEPTRELTVAGVVKVTSPPELATPPLITAVAFQVAGTTVPLGRDGSYRVGLRLNGGRVKLVACGCKECSGPGYIALDDRTTYHQDVTFQDTCID